MNSDFSEISFSGKRSFNHFIAISDVFAVLHPKWTETSLEVEISGESSGKIFWSISTYVSMVTVTVMLAKEQVKEIIESIPVEILQSVIEEFSRRIRNYCSQREIVWKVNRCNTILKSHFSASFCFIYLPWILTKL